MTKWFGHVFIVLATTLIAAQSRNKSSSVEIALRSSAGAETFHRISVLDERRFNRRWQSIRATQDDGLVVILKMVQFRARTQNAESIIFHIGHRFGVPSDTCSDIDPRLTSEDSGFSRIDNGRGEVYNVTGHAQFRAVKAPFFLLVTKAVALRCRLSSSDATCSIDRFV